MLTHVIGWLGIVMEITDNLVNCLQEMQTMLRTSEDNTIKRINNIHRECKSNEALLHKVSGLLYELTMQLDIHNPPGLEVSQTVRLCQLYIDSLMENNASLFNESSEYMRNMFNEHALTIKMTSNVMCNVLTGQSVDHFLNDKVS